MVNIEWFFDHTALIGVFIASIVATGFALVKMSDLKKIDYSVLAISLVVALANHNF